MIEGKKVNIIQVEWDGPFLYETDCAKFQNDETDYGLYQIYGTHSIFGSDSLLYIGKAQEQKLANRLSQHKHWLEKEHGKIEVYVGRLGGGSSEIEDAQWSREINVAERLLIYNCAPPYNTTNLSDFGNIGNTVDIIGTIVVNYGIRHRLPFEVSTFLRDGEFYKNEGWKRYIYNGPA